MACVTVAQGTLKGGISKSDNGVDYYEFLGVPYAKPPIGNLRFRNPQPAEPWSGVRDVTNVQENKISLQMDMLTKTLTGSEDCLYLNVYTPHLPDSKSELLPVMVFIHGGGFFCSNGILKEDLGPDYLIENDVVVVTLNYRLGALGFLSLDIPEASGNMGLKDQVQALNWIQKNIIKFSGDPNNVTIFGISAGSASVDYLILSPSAKGLFHKAILQSGSSLNHWAINFDKRKIVVELLNNMEYKGSLEDSQEIYEYLLSIPASLITEAAIKVMENSSSERLCLGFVPTIEKDFGNNEEIITENPYKLFKEGKFNHVPVIKGFCNMEGYLTNVIKPKAVLKLTENKQFLNHWPYKTELNEKKTLEPKFLASYSQNINPDDEQDKMAIDFFSDMDFVAGIWLSGETMASYGVPVYFYQLCYEGNINFFKIYFGMKRKGTAHGDDIAYIFRHSISKHAQDTDIVVRTNMTKMWTNFAKTSIPTSDSSTIHWPAYNKDTQLYLSIDKDLKIKSNYEPEQMALFQEIYDKFESSIN